jgi:signal recognition particle subunit SEC65
VRSMHTKATRRRGRRMSGELAVVSMILKTGVGALESVNLARSTAAPRFGVTRRIASASFHEVFAEGFRFSTVSG